MKKNKVNKKNKIPTDKQIKKLFMSINKFQKDNMKYLLLTENKIINTSSGNIFTTNNTNL